MKRVFEHNCNDQRINDASIGIRRQVLVACSRGDHQLQVWQDNGNTASTINVITSPECVALSHDEHHLAYGSVSGAVKIIDVITGKETRTLGGHRAKVLCVAQSTKSIYTWASGAADSALILWDIRRHPAIVHTFTAHRKPVGAIQFSPHGCWLASGSDDCTLKLYDTRNDASVLADMVGHSGAVCQLRFHPSEYLLASASADKTVRFWDLETRECVTQSEPTESALRSICFSHDGAALFTATDQYVRSVTWEPYDMLGMAPIETTTSTTLDMAVTSDGVRLAVFGNNSRLSLLDADITTLLTLPDEVGGCNNKKLPALGRNSMRRSFYEPPSLPPLVHPADEESSSETEESSCASAAALLPGSLDTSPVHNNSRDESTSAMPPRKNSKLRTKSNRSSSPTPSAVTTNSPTLAEDEIFKKRDKLAHSRPSSPPSASQRFDFPPSEETFVVSVVTGAGAKLPPSTTNKTSTSNRKTDSLAVGIGPSTSSKTVERRTSFTASKSGRSKSAVATVQPLGVTSISNVKKVEKVSPLPRTIQQSSLMQTAQMSSCSSTLPGGVLEPSDFLPTSEKTDTCLKHVTTAMKGKDCLTTILGQSQTMEVVLQHRYNAVAALRHTWSQRGLSAAIDVALQTNDQTLIIELLNALGTRSSLWSLGVCASLLPEIARLLDNKHDVYVQTAVSALRLIITAFGPVIKSGVQQTTPSIGVDVLRDERLEKCRRCYTQLKQIRLFTEDHHPKMGAGGARNGSKTMRELNALMQLFDDCSL